MRIQPGRAALAAIAVTLVIVSAMAAIAVWSGVYNVAASSPHTQPVFSLLEFAMTRSVRLRARSEMPPTSHSVAAAVERGAVCYREHCEQCHGGPGAAPRSVTLGMQPLPGPLVGATQRWSSRELYWVTRNGITMSGMPAWRYRLDDEDLWSIVAFVETLPNLSAADYRAATSSQAADRCAARERQVSGGDAERGRRALSQYGCNGCHVIPGVTGADVHVGPPLAGIGRRQLIAGQLANTPENMVHWLMDPKAIDPQTTMPTLGVSEADAHDIAAFMRTLQ